MNNYRFLFNCFISLIIAMLFSCSNTKKIPPAQPIGPSPEVTKIVPEKKQEKKEVRIERLKTIDPLAAFQIHGTKALAELMEATLGGIAGNIISQSMDSITIRIRSSIPHATVERIAEGVNITFESEYSSANELNLSKEKLSVWDNADQTLAELIAVFNDFPGTNILIESHLYSKSTAQTRAEQAKQRAEAFRNYFRKHGIADSRLSLKSYINSSRLASKSNKNPHSKIQFVLTAGDLMRADAKRKADIF